MSAALLNSLGAYLQEEYFADLNEIYSYFNIFIQRLLFETLVGILSSLRLTKF